MANPKNKTAEDTPLMKQYYQIKGKYPDAILLFRVGDFYETFGEDAKKVAVCLGIVLTKRGAGSSSEVELAGFPHHALDAYLPKLVRAGYRVAICDQLEDPKLTKTIVKRGVTELITPGVSLNDKILDHRKNNFLAAIHYGNEINGISFLDISTGEFLVAEGSLEQVEKLLQSFQPSEVLFTKAKSKFFSERFGEKFYTYALDEWIFGQDYAKETILKHFNVLNLKGFGLDGFDMAQVAAGVIIHYLKSTEHSQLQHITTISRIAEEKYVWLDRFTIRNLELVDAQYPTGTSLLQIIDHTITAPGARLLKKWLLLPLKVPAMINERLSMVSFFIEQENVSEKINKQLQIIGDLERLIAKVPMRRIQPRELLSLKRSLQALIELKEICLGSGHAYLEKIGDQIHLCNTLRERIEREIEEEAPAIIQKGGVIKSGIDKELDDLRTISFSGKDYLLEIQKREILATGISSLKISYNNVFGYYLEVTNKYKDVVPSTWIRKQTLSNAERYITEELKEYETKILGAEEKIFAIEERCYLELVDSIMEYLSQIQINAQLVARLDCLLSFAKTAKINNYYKPVIDESLELKIVQGRHPVIEKQIPLGEAYVPNDLMLHNDGRQIIIITGPNMSGKSAILRQTALIVLMAQMGSYVPAQVAKIGVIDKIFTRVGASDNISSGESTFMVEMNETASIMNNISERSLILLDEIGRGTSTFDGISIAWSLAEYLYQNDRARPKTLFATHYHELNELAEKFDRIENFHVATKEIGQQVIFLRKLVEGGSHHSFGIHVARMAGMPKQVLQRATEILTELEKKSLSGSLKETMKELPKKEYQLSLFQIEDNRWEKIKPLIEQLDVNTLSPVEALFKLDQISRLYKEG